MKPGDVVYGKLYVWLVEQGAVILGQHKPPEDARDRIRGALENAGNLCFPYADVLPAPQCNVCKGTGSVIEIIQHHQHELDCPNPDCKDGYVGTWEEVK